MLSLRTFALENDHHAFQQIAVLYLSSNSVKLVVHHGVWYFVEFLIRYNEMDIKTLLQNHTNFELA